MAKVLKAHEETQRIVSSFEHNMLEAAPAVIEEELELTPEEILHAARTEAEAKVKEAYREGYQRGLENGREAFDASLAHCAEALRASASAIEEAHARFLDSLTPQVLELVNSITRSILKREAKINPIVVAETTRAALQQLQQHERLTVHVNPCDLKALKEQRVSLLEEFDILNDLEILPDAEVTPGGCRVDSEYTNVDGQLEAQLAQIMSQLME